MIAVEPAARATAADERDVPSAAIEILRKNGGSLGTWLVSDGLGAPQTFDCGGRTWMITLRPARYYKPYSVTLQKFTHEKYAGTEIPKNCSSKVTLIDPERSVDRGVLIYMNHPLRYRGETFYQAGFQPDDSATILQVVHNPSFIAPYVACVIVVAGQDAALASVVGGLVGAPVIGVPTSTGYGAALGGVSALLAMLCSCAAGVAVVNIDDGFGAGTIAARIARSAAAPA